MSCTLPITSLPRLPVQPLPSTFTRPLRRGYGWEARIQVFAGMSEQTTTSETDAVTARYSVSATRKLYLPYGRAPLLSTPKSTWRATTKLRSAASPETVAPTGLR